jgi:hypothetical protein
MNKDNLKSDIKYNLYNHHYHHFHENPSPVACSKAKEGIGYTVLPQANQVASSAESDYIKMF